MSTSALAIFTGKGTPVILEVGGTQSWVLDRDKARACKYAVLFFNELAPWSTKNFEASHHQAFLVGRISDVVQSSETPDRWLVEFDEFAELTNGGGWGGWRNPVHYSTLEELRIDVSRLSFKPMPAREQVKSPLEKPSGPKAANLTIEAAKIGLAATYGVSTEAIEIIIRG